MLITNVKKSLVGLFTLASSCVMLHAAAFVSDFNSGQPPGTAIAGSSVADSTGGVGNSGVLKITTAANTEAGGFEVTDFNGGAPVTNFIVKFKLLLGGGTCCGNRMADGISLNFANGINAGMVPGEEGIGTGITLTFDTWDNAGDDTAPAIDIRSGGAIVAFQAFDPGPGNEIRDLNRAPAGPIFLNNDDHPMSIFTVGAYPAPLDNFVDVVLELSQFNGSNTLSLSFSNQVVFSHVPINYTPIAGGSWVFGGRTGGANEAAYVDNLSIAENFNSGPATITGQPADTTVTEGQVASFSLQVDGTPPYAVQWFHNGVLIPGANGLSYSLITSTNNNGDTFYAEVSNDQNLAGPVVSDTATLTVEPGAFARKATSKGNPNAVYVTYNKPVNLDGTYTLDGGITITSTSYGASHSEVVLEVSPLNANTTYHVTVTGVTGEDGSSLVPPTTILTFFHGFGGPYCTDFASGVPVNSTLYGTPAGTAYISGDGILHIMDNINGVAGAWIIDNLSSGNPTDRWHAKMKVHLGEGSDASRPDGGLADGLSLSWASDLPNGTVGNAEDGAGSGISVSLDTWDDGSGYDPSIEVRWKGNILGHVHKTLARTNFVDFEVNLDPDGTIDVAYDGDTVFNNLPIPGFTPIANARFGLFGRTGGMNMNAWVDDFCLNNFTLGPVNITQQPVDANAREGETATYTVALDGTPPYTYQWYKNSGTLIPGATGKSYTTPPATAADEGSTYFVVVSNDFSTDTSGAAALHVRLNPRVLSVYSRDDSGLGVSVVHVLYSRPVDLFSGSYDVSTGFEGSRDYGVDHKEVVVTLDTLLPQNQTYSITISGVADETDPLNTIDPDPTVKTFFHGFGPYCNDFTGVNMPAGSAPQGPLAVYGSAYVTNGVVHLTDAVSPGGQSGAFVIQDPLAGANTVDRIQIRYAAVVGGPGTTGTPADGYSLSIGPDVPNGTSGEEGAGTGLIFSFDNYNNDAVDDAPAIDLKWNGARIAHVKTTVHQSSASGNFLPVYINVDPDGTVDVLYNGVYVYNNFPTPFRGFRNPRYSFAGRTGGLWENNWIDNLCINNFSLTAPVVTVEPADATVPELASARFSFDVDGVPPYSIQWYSNDVAIAGATSFIYVNPGVDRRGDGSVFYAVISNDSGTTTTRGAVLHITQDNVAASVLWAAPMPGYNAVLALFSETLDTASATVAGNYSVNNGLTVSSATILSGGRLVRLALSGALNPVNCNVLTVNGVKDLTLYNTTVSRTAIQMGGPSQGSGGLVVIEAEAFSANRSPGLSTPNNRWTLGSSLPGSVNGYVESTPDLGVNIGSTTPELTTAMDYPVNFAVAGTYYIFGRAATTHNDGSDNSFHLLVDGASQGNANLAIGNDVNSWGGANPNDFGWVFHANGDVNLRASVNIATPGLHLLTVSMREDGLKLDRFLLTTDVNFTLPTNDPGPAASTITPTHTMSLVRDTGGNATLSWSGAGWTLQGTTKLENNPALNVWQDLAFPSGTVIPAGYFGTGETNVFFRLICK